MLSSEDWALLVTLKKELERMTAVYKHPCNKHQTVIWWLQDRVKDLETKLNDS